QNDRDELKAKLATFGVQTMIYYPVPLHLQEVYQTSPCRFSSLPVVEQVAQEVLSLPMFPGLSVEEQDQVIQSLQTILGE
ncbi:MAG: DegT/DnrJ/EryC1/StrS family aminotransferase, partial [Prochlorotrichaceae cyanobacterium]